MGEFNLLTIAVKWALLILYFLFLTYLFRDRVFLEGFLGYTLIVFVVIPINLLVRSYVETSTTLSYDEAALVMAGMLFGLNLILLFAINRFLPGLTASNAMTLLIFILIFTAGSMLVHHIPNIPGVHTWR